MSVISRGFRKLGFYVVTAISRIRWQGLSIDGLFRKRWDTQIIISENGKMSLGKNIRFQKNVSLTSVGGY